MAGVRQSPNHYQRPQTSKGISKSVFIFSLLAVAALGFLGGAFSDRVRQTGLSSIVNPSELELSSLQTTYQALKQNYDGEIDQAKLIDGAKKGLVAALDDPYTVYMTEKEASEFNDELSGNIGGGIGVEMSIRNEAPTVVRVVKDNPAEKAGILINDIIVAVNDESTQDKSLNDVTKLIRGEKGTTVKITINRGGTQKEFTITRANIDNPSAYGEVRDGIGYLTISRFDEQTGSLARKLARDFKEAGVKGVVLDLRGNGGGYVTAAQDVASLWLEPGQVIVSEREGEKVIEELKAKGEAVLKGVKTTVLVNGSSASASEIVAGALRDHKVATLVGETTFGKGSVQKMVNLSGGSMLKVTIARWYTPVGVNISETGIKPDNEVKRTPEDFNANKDPQLDAARAALN